MRFLKLSDKVPEEVTTYLLPHEQPVIAVRKHPAILVTPVILLVASCVAAALLTVFVIYRDAVALGLVWAACLAVALYAVERAVAWLRISFVLTKARMILISGLTNRTLVTLPLVNITDVTFVRSKPGRLLGYGKITVTSADPAPVPVNYVPYPELIWQEVRELVQFGDYAEDELADTPGQAPAGQSAIVIRDQPIPAPRRTSRRRVSREPAAGVPSLPSFTPTPVDKEAQRRWVVQHIDELSAHSIDSAQHHLFDASIDDKADQWIAQANREFADYIGRQRQLRGRAQATVLHRQHLQQAHDQRVAEALSARTAAADRLHGEDDEGKWDQLGHADPTLLSGRSGASLSHILLRRSFARTVRAHESAIRQQAVGARDLASAEAERDAIDHQEQAAAEVRDSTIEELHKLADELKRLARLQLAKKIRDVSDTDASPENAEPLSHAEHGDGGELHP